MSSLPTWLVIAPALLTCVSLSDCGRTEAVAPSHPDVSAYDLEFITNLYNVVEFDREVIGTELNRSTDPRAAALAAEDL